MSFFLFVSFKHTLSRFSRPFSSATKGKKGEQINIAPRLHKDDPRRRRQREPEGPDARRQEQHRR